MPDTHSPHENKTCTNYFPREQYQVQSPVALPKGEVQLHPATGYVKLTSSKNDSWLNYHNRKMIILYKVKVEVSLSNHVQMAGPISDQPAITLLEAIKAPPLVR